MENNELEAIGVRAVDQGELESSITRQANAVLRQKERDSEEKRLEKTKKDIQKTLTRIRGLEKRLENPRTKLSQQKQLKDEIQWFRDNELAPLRRDLDDINGRLEDNEEVQVNAETTDRLPGESERDYLVRTGKITAFGNQNAFLQNGESGGATSHRFLRAPGFGGPVEVEGGKENGKWKGEKEKDASFGEIEKPELSSLSGPSSLLETPPDDNILPEEPKDGLSPLEDYKSDDYLPEDGEKEDLADVESPADLADDFEDHDDFENTLETPEKSLIIQLSSIRNTDDGNEANYQARLADWVARRSALRQEAAPDKPEWFLPHPTTADAVLNEAFRLPGDIYPALFDYQKTCVQWLWELYSQKTGGIVGDEMGLGKTVQVIAFLAGLHYLGLLDKPVLVVVPATVLSQWVNEFHRWWPPMRCVILHSMGSGMGRGANDGDSLLEEAEVDEEELYSRMAGSKDASSSEMAAKKVVDRVVDHGHVIVTTYVGLRVYRRQLVPRRWGYVVLDEGHKIRNPDAAVLLTCKQLKTPHRLILSGTPIQNNLVELWLLFDFVFPGRLGTLPVFQQQFAVPINMGGYANASNVQVQTGYKCAVVLRDLVAPYLLRRMKLDVAQDLPKKTETVLFVKLTRTQVELYERFLASDDLGAIMKGKRNVLMGVDILRKVCNHPDLVDREVLLRKRGYAYGHPSKSGKMQVLKGLLQLWQRQGHRALLFCQTRQMLDILETFVGNLDAVDDNGAAVGGFLYLRMDGSTPISRRQTLVDTFNTDLKYNVFLLTTKVGGLGVNLTGADRVVIYDPDWNPSTDIQARERAWRLGQTKDIAVYRLMTAGSIEEKIYHRQIFKTFLTNKILKDPKQRRFFKVNDLHDLFTLGDPDEKGTETGDMFAGTELALAEGKARKPGRLTGPKHKNDDDFYQVAAINGVAKLDKFKGEEEDKESDESRLMEGIFASGGVHSTLQHDMVVDLAKHEMSLVEKEASRVASEAAEALKESRKIARKSKIGTPTWTGKFGAAGRFGPSNSGRSSPLVGPQKRASSLSPAPLSLTSILGDLKRIKSVDSGDKFAFGSNKKAKKAAPDKSTILKALTEYLGRQEGSFGTSNDILKNMPEMGDLLNEKDMILVRLMLREVAQWDQQRKGWELRPEFR